MKLSAAADTLTRIRTENIRQTSQRPLFSRSTESCKRLTCSKYLQLLGVQGNAEFCPEVCMRLSVFSPLLSFYLAAVGYRTLFAPDRFSEPGIERLSPSSGCRRCSVGAWPSPARVLALQPLGSRRPLWSQLQSAFFLRFWCGGPGGVTPARRAFPTRRLSCSIPFGICGFRSPSPICSPFADPDY